ncbi:hypothetical protein MNV49_001130 [Pseudohyphozyma bogoriensis]|nr:hypothetical protein MNV49_001130 [Pseudohyphozyma bogoriensis]
MATSSPLQDLRAIRKDGLGFGDTVPITSVHSAERTHAPRSGHRPSPSLTIIDIKLAPAAASGRKFSLQHASASTISYPTLVSRNDAVPSASAFTTYAPAPLPPSTPPLSKRTPAVLPNPTPPSSGSSKSRPPPIKIASSNHATFRPFKGRFGKDKGDRSADEETPESPTKMLKFKSKKGSKEGAKPEGDETVKRILKNQEMFFAQFPMEHRRPSQPDVVAGTRPEHSRADSAPHPRDLSPPSSRVERAPAPTLDDIRFDALFPGVGPALEAATSTDPSRHTKANHRRAASVDESPKLRPQARMVDVNTGNPAWRATSYVPETKETTPVRAMSRPRPRPRLPSPPPTPTSNRSASSPAIFANPIVRSTPSPSHYPSSHTRTSSNNSAKFKPRENSDAFYSVTTPTSAAPKSRTPVYTLSPPPDATNLVGIAVQDSTGSRELGKAALGAEGVAVKLRSALRPDEVEVSWTSSTGYDEHGQPYLQWELKLVPRLAPPFADYRLAAAAPLSPIRSSPHEPHQTSPTSPRTSRLYPSAAPETDLLEEPTMPRERQPSATHSEKTSGSSFSSESSGPVTPRRTKFGVDSDLVAIASTQRRIARQASYASLTENPNSRKPSVDEDYGRNGSVSSSVGFAEEKPRSPKNRFARVITPAAVTAVPVLVAPAPQPDSTFSSPSEPSESPPNLHYSSSKIRHKPSRSEGQLAALTPDPSDDGEGDDDFDQDGDDMGPSQRDVMRSLARQKNRAMSKWSDTDGDSDEETGPKTSWANVPDDDSESM